MKSPGNFLYMVVSCFFLKYSLIVSITYSNYRVSTKPRDHFPLNYDYSMGRKAEEGWSEEFPYDSTYCMKEKEIKLADKSDETILRNCAVPACAQLWCSVIRAPAAPTSASGYVRHDRVRFTFAIWNDWQDLHVACFSAQTLLKSVQVLLPKLGL